MRYSLMLQIVGTITAILVVSAGLFAWLQSRPQMIEDELRGSENSLSPSATH